MAQAETSRAKSKTTGSKNAKASGGKKTAAKAKSSSRKPARSAKPKGKTVKASNTMPTRTKTSKTAAAKAAGRASSKLKAAKPAGRAGSKAKAPKSSATKGRRGATTAAKTRTSPRAAAAKKRQPARKPQGVIASVVDKVSGLFGAGSSDAIDLLKTDHRKVEELFEKVKANEDANNATVFSKIKTELDLHAHIEEMIFYPHLLENGDNELKKIVREGVEEHRQVKMFLAELDSLSGDTEKFKAKLKVLIEDVEHHVQEEENEMFPLVEDQIDEEMLVRLGSLLQAEKQKQGGGRAG